MVGRVYSVAFQGVDVLEIDVQVQTSGGRIAGTDPG
ncbi:MAG: hypothetical protein K0R52_131 [Alphaproteobacteria bacterium]|nr:hypothetical protein [Alphaproteobacteria bacterium]